MADDRLKNFVLSLADTDYTLSEQVRLVVLAALEGSNDLAEVLGDDATSSELVESLTAVEEDGAEPVGAYLRSITVQGFRGIGAQVTLPFRPGPGLIVVAGRNGSGKSTLAEGLELALTGTNSRWNDKAAVWSQNWRNLHAGDPAHIRVDIAEEGSGATTIGVDWPAGEGVDVDDFKAWVQRDGKKREDTSVLGWAGALEMYRPLLSYDELGGILEGRPSDFYDQLHKLLGLEQLTEAMARLDAEVKQLKQPSVELRKARDALRPKLESHEDPRAATALAQLKKRRPDLDAIRAVDYRRNRGQRAVGVGSGRAADDAGGRGGGADVRRPALGGRQRAGGGRTRGCAGRRPRPAVGDEPRVSRPPRRSEVSRVWTRQPDR